MSQQTYQMNLISHILANFKKLGKAKMTLFITWDCLARLKETFIRSQKLHYMITRIANKKLKATHMHTSLKIDSWHVRILRLDYMVKILGDYESNPAAPDTDGSFLPVIVASPEDQLADLRR